MQVQRQVKRKGKRQILYKRKGNSRSLRDDKEKASKYQNKNKSTGSSQGAFMGWV
jgi:hypothetical protein